jgi:hypothetical protein
VTASKAETRLDKDFTPLVNIQDTHSRKYKHFIKIMA